MGQTRNGKRFLTKKYKDFKQEVQKIIDKKGYNLTGFIKVEVLLITPDRRKRDIANINKCLMDALESSGLFEDDYYIDQLVEGRKRSRDGSIYLNKQGGWVEVTLEELPYEKHFEEIENET